MAACYNIIIEFEEHPKDQWDNFDFNLLKTIFLNADRIDMGSTYFRSDFCESDDRENFLYALAILIRHIKEIGLRIKLCYLDGLEDILKENYQWFSELSNTEREFTKAQFRGIKVVVPSDTDHETILQNLKRGYDYRPNNA